MDNILALQKERLLSVLSKEPVVQFLSVQVSIYTRYTSFSESVCSTLPPVDSFSWLMGEKMLQSVSLFNLSKTSLPVFIRNQQWWEAVGCKAHFTECQWLESLIVALQLHRQISSGFQIVFQEVVMLLLQHNADPSIVNGSGETAKEVTYDKDIRNMLEGNLNRSKFVLGFF